MFVTGRETVAAKRLPRIASAWDDLPQIAISGGALVSSAPTKQTVILPQIAQIDTEAANFRLVHFLLGWCT